MVHEKRTKKKTGILLLAAVLLLGIVVTIRVITDRGQTKDRISVAEAENELEEATGVSLKLDGAYLTYADVEEVVDRLHLNDYIAYEKKSGAKKILREEWNPIYDKILDYLDSEHRIQKKVFWYLAWMKRRKAWTPVSVLFLCRESP